MPQVFCIECEREIRGDIAAHRCENPPPPPLICIRCRSVCNDNEHICPCLSPDPPSKKRKRKTQEGAQCASPQAGASTSYASSSNQQATFSRAPKKKKTKSPAGGGRVPPNPTQAGASSSRASSSNQQATFPRLHIEKEAFHNNYVEWVYELDTVDPLLVIPQNRSFFRAQLERYFLSLENPRAFVKCQANLVVETEKQNLTELNSSQARSFVLALISQTINIDEVNTALDAWQENIEFVLPLRLSRLEGSGHIIKKCLTFNLLFLRQAIVNVPGAPDVMLKGIQGAHSLSNPTGILNSCLIQCLAAYVAIKCKGYFLPHETHYTGKLHGLKRHLDSLHICAKYINWNNISFPVQWEDIGTLERLNNLSVFIYNFRRENDDNVISLVRKGRRESGENFVPLLLLEEEQHFCLILDFHEFMRKHTRNRHVDAFYCPTCLIPHSSLLDCQQHEKGCDIAVKLRFNSPGAKLKFKDYHKTHMHSHIGVFDLESLLRKSNKSNRIEATHEACASCFIIFDCMNNVVSEFIDCGADTVDKFVQCLLKEWERIKEKRTIYPLDMSSEDEERFQNTTHCQNCGREFNEKRIRCRHHNHMSPTSNYISALCNTCNFYASDRYGQLPIFAHNADYDLGLILKQLEGKYKIDVITKNELHYLELKIENTLVFRDSYRFMQDSLGTLAENFFRDGKTAQFTRHMLRYITNDEDRAELIKGKEVLCYDYLDDPSKLEETQLPPKEAFYNRLKDKQITEEEYTRAQRIWRIGKCNTIKDYLLLYLRIDTGLLGDILQDWRNILFEKYSLDLAYFVSLPSFAYQAFLKQSGVEIDHIYTHEIYNLIRKNLVGGFSGVMKQKFTANNKHINANFDPIREASSYLLYLDFNSLYPTVMRMKLPQGGIRKLGEDEHRDFLETKLHSFDWESNDLNYWLFIDSKHVSNNVAAVTDDLPLVMSHEQISMEDLSPYCRRVLKCEGGTLYENNEKLVASHRAKKGYLIALPLLQLKCKLGLEIEKVHAIYEYKQSTYMRSFIENNIKYRNQAKTIMERNCFKAMSNSVFGKTLVNVLRYNTKSKIVTDKKTFLKEVRNPRLKNVVHLRKDRVICTSHKETATIDFPNYIGFYILDMAKYYLYNFYYNVLKKKYSRNVTLCYTDTDSFILGFKCQDIYQEMTRSPLKDYLDLSNFPRDHQIYDGTKKGQLGLLKSETAHIHIKELRALKAKMYCLSLDREKKNISRGKGVPKHEQQKLTFEQYDDILRTHQTESVTVRNIQNIKGQMCTVKMDKITLSAFDDKRWHINASESRAYGHPDVAQPRRSVESDEIPHGIPPGAHASKKILGYLPLEYQNLWGSRERMADKYFRK